MSEINVTEINVTAYFRLGQIGQQAAILAGRDAKTPQTITGVIPASDIELCQILEDGSVVLAHRLTCGDSLPGIPGFEAIRTDKLPDSPGDLVLILRQELAAAELATARETEKDNRNRAREAAQKAADQATLLAIQKVLDSDPDATPDVPWMSGNTDRDIRCEIRRRLNLAEEAKANNHQAWIHSWLAEHGTQNQLERFAAGLLPREELHDAIANLLFAPLVGFELLLYDVYRRPNDDDAAALTAAQWQKLKALRAALPAAAIDPKVARDLTTDDDDDDAYYPEYALASITAGGITVTRAFVL